MINILGMMSWHASDMDLCYQSGQAVELQGKSEGLDSCDWYSNLTQIGFKSSIILFQKQ